MVRTIMLGYCVDPNFPNRLFGKPLAAAARRGDNDMVELLLDGDADINGKDPIDEFGIDEEEDYGSISPFEASVVAGQEHTVRLLLSSPSLKPRWNNYDYMTIQAARHGHAQIIRLLMEPTEADEKPRLRERLVCEAARCGQGVHVDAIWDYGTPLQLAASFGRANVVRLLLARGADRYADRDGDPLFRAAKGGHEEVVQILLEDGFDVNGMSGNLTAFCAAAQTGRTDMMRFLLDRGADLDAYMTGEKALFEAARDGQVSVVHFLVELGLEVDGPNEHLCPMIGAMLRKRDHVVETLTKLGAKKVDTFKSVYALEFRRLDAQDRRTQQVSLQVTPWPEQVDREFVYELY
ncbi:MAG: hypothetical protein M1816_004213 [Peltula sp. TS41687]|nr:MAG: hypothetical protein M1816_004213 [Peltula sp. TS41687]